MRLTKTLAAGAVALSALVTLTGCGDDSGAAADGPQSNLPKASTMADVQKAVVERGVACESSDQDLAYMKEEAKDPAWGIQERTVCQDGGGGSVTLLLLGDMTKFQESLAKGGGGSLVVGQNFAVAAESDSAGQSLVKNGLLQLSCEQGERDKVPSGFEIHEGLVKGCFTTNYDL